MLEQIDIFKSVDWRDPPGRLPTPNDNPVRQTQSRFHVSERLENVREPAIRQCRVASFDLWRALSCQ